MSEDIGAVESNEASPFSETLDSELHDGRVEDSLGKILSIF